MESKFGLFVVFAVLTQSCLGSNDTELIANLTAIQSAHADYVVQYNVILDGFVEAIHLVAALNCGDEHPESATVNSTVEAIQRRQFKASNAAFDDTRIGLRHIARDAAVLDLNLEGSYSTFAEEVLLVHSLSELFPSQNYSETAAAIEDIKNIAVHGLGKIFAAVYVLIEEAVSAENPELRNVLDHVEHTAVLSAQASFDVIVSAFKIVLIQTTDSTQCQTPACLSAIQTRKNRALSELLGEVRTRFDLFQYIAVADYLGDYELLADFNKIRTAEISAITATEYAFDYMQNTLISAAEYGVTPEAIDNLSFKLSATFSTVCLNTITAISYMKPQGSATVAVNAASLYDKIDKTIVSITNALELYKTKNIAKALAKLEAFEKTGTADTLGVYKHIYDEMAIIAGSIDEELGDAVRIAWNTTAIFMVKRVVHDIHAGIRIALAENILESKTGCGAGPIAIKSAYSRVFYNLNNGITQTFSFIRAVRLFDALKAQGIDVPLSAIYAPA